MSLQILTTLSQQTPWPFLGPSRQRTQQWGLSSEPSQTMLYCTWRFKAKDSVPESSDSTHIREGYQSSAITMIPPVASSVTGATASRALTALHIPETNQNHLFAVSLIWSLPLLFLFFGFLFFFNKILFFWLINSQQHWTQRITFKGSRYSGPKTKTALIFTRVMLLCDCLGGCKKK